MPDTYLRVRSAAQLHKGQPVWNLIRFGTKESDVHYKQASILEVMRAAVRVKFLDDGREVVLRFNEIVTKVEVERRSTVPPAPTPLPPPTVAPPPRLEETPVAPKNTPPPVHLVPKTTPPASKPQDAVDAWLDMGKDVLDTLSKDIDATLRLHSEAQTNLDNLDKTHRAEIARLEEELREAKQRHRQERSIIDNRVETTKIKLQTLKTRRDLINSVLTAK